MTDEELVQQLNGIQELELNPRVRRELLRLIPVNEVVQPLEQINTGRIRELELQLELERERNKDNSFSAFGSLQGCFKINSSNLL